MKKIIACMALASCVVGLAGCNNGAKAGTKVSNTEKERSSYAESSSSTNFKTSNDTSTSTSKQSSSSSAAEKKESTVNQSVAAWDSQKASELQTFMENWGSTMGQSYKEYRPNNNANFYGLMIPDDVLGNTKKWSVAVNDNIVSAEWSDSGESASEYSIVSVYSDVDSPSTVKHVYFFGFNNNQPVVLVSMQNQGMSDNALHFRKTENNDLNAGFQNIAAGNAVNQPTPVNNSWSSIDEAIQFYEDTYKNPANEISKNIAWENYDRKCWSLVEQSGNRIVLHWTNISGAGGSYDEFIKNGDTTELRVYDGNATYPNAPSSKYTIRNSDHSVI